MANYSYKDTCSSIPYFYEESFDEKYGREFDGDANYDGDYWLIADDYISDLESRLNEYKSLANLTGVEAVDKLIELSSKKVWEE